MGTEDTWLIAYELVMHAVWTRPRNRVQLRESLVQEVAGSHAVYVSLPQAVAAWIEDATPKLPAEVVAR